MVVTGGEKLLPVGGCDKKVEKKTVFIVPQEKYLREYNRRQPSPPHNDRADIVNCSATRRAAHIWIRFAAAKS